MSDTHIPEDLRYTAEHEWVRVVETTTIRLGITDFAQEQLGDIVFVDLPDVEDTLAAGDSFAEVESTKSVSDIYAPVAGRVVAINDALGENPELVNSDPYGQGWLIEIAVDDQAALAEGEGLLDADEYLAVVESA
ncbi:glycine cleavage system protein GcvH [Millisia brevis]|uniref:glycine cleavage system protein GcvH n=1 Tax=Millisia brevis TaxID=264148 RepID=UPI000833611A|nr:glycine cleavage system protein GcvH [Millisia brevis]